ncbi:hypothetical protein EV361DRAFT_813500, partial [Lentinula raphanica]
MVTWLQSYLDLTPDRATWAYVADAIIAHHIPKMYENIDEFSRINIFLQSWNTDLKNLPEDIKKMIDVAKKNNLRLEGLAFPRSTIRQMPIWLHCKEKKLRSIHNNKLCKCLRENHKVRTVGDAEDLANQRYTNRHTNRRNCRCAACSAIRNTTDCPHPNKCMTKAHDIIKLLPPKWNPLSRLPEDYEPVPTEQSERRTANTFNSRVTTHGDLSDAFRIFTEGEACEDLPDTEQDAQTIHQDIEVYTDGSCVHNGTDEASAGAGIHFPGEEFPDCAIK